jgi:GT2 family glycosyltransferase
MTRPRVLLAVTVYNGRDVVERTLQSAAGLERDVADVDVLVLDDASPDPGFSDEVASWCAYHGHRYYRSPRNLGIPRNVNLGLLAAMDGNYDHVIISNSDVVYGSNAVDELVRAAQSDARIGAVTSWSTNVSLYSLSNRDPDRHLTTQANTDAVAHALASEFSGQILDIPAGISFSMLIPVPVVRTVGLMDPVFGRGYCEETDWSQRCLAAGYRLGLGLGSFVYHAGGGSTVDAGVLAPGNTTVPGNERIIDMRYPEFRSNVDMFYSSGALQRLQERASSVIIGRHVERHGYRVSIGLRPRTDGSSENDPALVDVVLDGEQAVMTVDALGFGDTVSGHALDVAAAVRQRFGNPLTVDLFDVGPWAWRAAELLAAGGDVIQHRNYPARV